jgi:hypothetical protein
MQGPIYKFYRLRTTEAFYALSQAEKDALLEKLNDLRTQHGGKRIVHCSSAWSNERWRAFGLEEFPDMQAVANHTVALLALDMFRCVESETMLGTPSE